MIVFYGKTLTINGVIVDDFRHVFAVPPHLSGFHHDKDVVFSLEWANSQRWTILHIFHVCYNLCGECGHYICSVFWGGGGNFSHVEMCILESLYFISQSFNILLYLVYWSTNIVRTEMEHNSIGVLTYNYILLIEESSALLSFQMFYIHIRHLGCQVLVLIVWLDRAY